MIRKRQKVFVALSGGVDSSTAAALLLEAGFDCSGLFMITSDKSQKAQANAEAVAKRLGIELHVLDVREDFEFILDYFCSEYERGRTPNPCVLCNRHIKFGKLWNFARENGADLLATGHYARILKVDGQARHTCGGQVGLYQATDTTKDQSYALSMIDKDVLSHVRLPVGGHSKSQTRKLAAKFGLGTEKRKESQEICFIPNDDYVGVLEQRCPELVRCGKIVDSSGKVLGEHNGVHRFTIGQRRGLRVAMGKPYYVVGIDAQSNTVTLGPKEEVMHNKLLARQANWLIDEPKSPFAAIVKTRYNNSGVRATVRPQEDAVLVEFEAAISAITPGQLAVLYVADENGNRVVGGAWIDNVIDQ
jgi:tRNA-specific 2-thiouridylase